MRRLLTTEVGDTLVVEDQVLRAAARPEPRCAALSSGRRRCVFLDRSVHAPHDLPGTILLPLSDFEVPKLLACGAAERRPRCEFDCSADKCILASDEDFVRLHLHLKTAFPDHLSIVFLALVPGLNWVTKIDVHIRITVETHDAFHVAGVKAFSELVGHVTQFRDTFQFGLDRRHGVSPGVLRLFPAYLRSEKLPAFRGFPKNGRAVWP
jgi:hypothetical protein